MKKITGKILASSTFARFAAFSAFAWTKLVCFSCRKIIINENDTPDSRTGMSADGEVRIVVGWHRNIILCPMFWDKNRPYRAMVSRHVSGNIAAEYLKLANTETFRGSGTGKAARKKAKNKGGTAATLKLLKSLKNGKNIVLNADMPPGPRCHFGKGPVLLSKYSQKPVVLQVARCTNEFVVERAWDKFIIPQPFGKIVAIFAKPVIVPEDADEDTVERYRQEFEKNLNELHAKAENLLKS